MAVTRLEIGTRVRVKAVLDFFYDEDNERTYQRDPVTFDAWITGATNKPMGIYYPSRRLYGMFGEPDEDEPARLDVTSTVFIYRVRQRLFGREFEVLPDDMETL